MKIFLMVSGLQKQSGGPSYTVSSLAKKLIESGESVEIDVLNPWDATDSNLPVIGHDRLPIAKKMGVSPSMRRSLLARVGKHDVIHSNGLWMMPNIYPLTIAQKTKSKYVISPRGMLSEWSLEQNRMIKKVVGSCLQKKVIDNASCISVTAESEYEDVRRFGYKGPVALIPNGIDLPSDVARHRDEPGKLKRAIFIVGFIKKR